MNVSLSLSSVFLPDLEGLYAVGLCVVAAYILLANTDFFLEQPDQTDVDTLAGADLRSTTGGETSQHYIGWIFLKQNIISCFVFHLDLG